MLIACSAAARSAAGLLNLMMIGIATPTVEPSLGWIVGDVNGASPVNGVGSWPASVPSGIVNGNGSEKIGGPSGGGAGWSSSDETSIGAADDGSFGAATSGSGSAMARGINPIMAASIVTETSAAAFRKNVKCTHEWLPACATTASSTNNGWAAKSDDGRPASGKLGA